MEVKKFQLILHITKLAKKNSKKLIANQILQNKDQLKAIKSFSLFLLSFKDEKIKDSVTIRDSSRYKMRSALPLS